MSHAKPLSPFHRVGRWISVLVLTGLSFASPYRLEAEKPSKTQESRQSLSAPIALQLVEAKSSFNTSAFGAFLLSLFAVATVGKAIFNYSFVDKPNRVTRRKLYLLQGKLLVDGA